MKFLYNIFVVLFFILFSSFIFATTTRSGYQGGSSNPGVSSKSKVNPLLSKPTLAKNALTDSLTSSGLVTTFSIPAGTMARLTDHIRRELNSYCPSEVGDISLYIGILWDDASKPSHSKAVQEIESRVKNCVSNITTKSDRVFSSFAGALNDSYSPIAGNLRSFSRLDWNISKAFNLGISGQRVPEKLKELKGELDNYKGYENACSTNLLKLCFLGDASAYQSSQPYECSSNRFRDLRSYLEKSWRGKKCKDWMSHFESYVRKPSFRDFVSLPARCRAGADKDWLELKKRVSGEESVLRKCQEAVNEVGKACFCKDCYQLSKDKACERVKSYDSASCEGKVSECKKACEPELEEFKRSYMEYFYVGMRSTAIHEIRSNIGSCISRVSELKKEFNESLWRYDVKLRSMAFSSMRGWKVIGELERGIISKCEAPLEDLEKQKESLKKQCAGEEEEEEDKDKEDDKDDKDKKDDEKKAGTNPQPLNTPFNYSTQGGSLAEPYNRSQDRNQDLQNPYTNAYANQGAMDSQYSEKIGYEKKDDKFYYEQLKRLGDPWTEDKMEKTLKEQEEKMMAECGDPKNCFMNDEGNFVTLEENIERTKKRQEEIAKQRSEEEGLLEKVHNKVDPVIRDYLRSDEMGSHLWNEDKQTRWEKYDKRYKVGVRGKLRAVRRTTKKGALAAYSAVVPESREAFRRRMQLSREGVDLYEAQRLMLEVFCFEKYPGKCGGIRSMEDYKMKKGRLEELSDRSLAPPKE